MAGSARCATPWRPTPGTTAVEILRAMSTPTTVNGIDELKALVGQTIGPSEWREVTQADIDKFAEVSGDHQWIHVDTERAKTESPFGTTIAHGNLTLCMCDGFRDQLFRGEGFKMGLNYGWNKVRYTSPVPSGARIRASLETLSVDEVGDGWYQLVQKWTVEIGGQARSMDVPGSASGGRRPLPGEHGFRFFPGFYQHVPETMGEIPVGGGRT